MRFALVSGHSPFDAAGDPAAVLARMLADRGHEVETILLPAAPTPDAEFEQMVAYRLLDVGDSIDRLVALRAPAHVVRHPHKIVWLFDPPAEEADEPPHAQLAPALRARRDELDARALREARVVYASSAPLAARLERRYGIRCDVLSQPLSEAESLEHLVTDRARTASDGSRGPVRVRALGIGWEGVVERLAA